MILKRLSAYFRLMRLHRPVGAVLLLWPVLWALWIAGAGKPRWDLVMIFCAGVFIMRTAGCVINDIADRHFDRHVARTKLRPLTSGEISLIEAAIIFILLLSCAFILVLHLNELAIKLSFLALFFACIYPLMKRWTHWPQLVLGLAYGMGVPMAFAAHLEKVPPTGWIIFVIAVLWPMMYDTEYAMVDRPDDLRIGIKSTAVLFGEFDVIALAVMQLSILWLWLILGWLSGFNDIYFMAVGLASLFFFYQLYLAQTREPDRCFRAFLNNQWVGLIIFVGIFLNYFL